MAEKVLDFTRTLGELTKDNPELAGELQELGFEELPPDKTIGEVAKAADVDLGVIAFALGASGYEIEGFERPEGSFESPLPDMVQALFEGTYKGEKLPDTTGTEGPMFAHMEMAIRRAKAEGRL